MLNLPHAPQVYLACGVIDLLKSIDGLAAVVQEQFELNLSKRDLQHRIYPCLLRGLPSTAPNQVWSVDITSS